MNVVLSIMACEQKQVKNYCSETFHCTLNPSFTAGSKTGSQC